ncbi:hypothetical protein [Hymenobacter sp. GOD-10R]|uniref:hypothetical protein n=1 Tax=Hymenobacter sp. GOD-10R TaxID=3093922 RepID=UPI002D79854C|nr:hypothetical protein [Hymenobacter sp. GOD-10R]WRQ30901.1 hypothetical protein SD425_11580 [Hymenobacter sp. GOD-10R]
MKKLPLLSYLCFTALLPLLSCSDDNAKMDGPAPAMHTVKVRYTGAKLDDLGAYVNAGCNQEDGSGPTKNMDTDISGGTAKGTITTYKVLTSKDYYVTLAFKRIKAGNRVPPGAYLKADILVDDVLRKSIRIDNTITPSTLCVMEQATIQHDEW